MALDPAIQAEIDRVLGMPGAGQPGFGPTAGPAAGTTGQGSNVPYPGATGGGTNVTDADRAVSGAGGGGGGGGGGDSYANIAAAQLAMQLAEAAAQREYLHARMREVEIPSMKNLDEREKERIRNEAARDAWTKTYQEALVGIQKGQMGIGSYDVTGRTTGYVPETKNLPSAAEQVHAAWDRLPPEQKTDANAALLWQRIVPGLTDQEANAVAQGAKNYFVATGQRITDTAAEQQLRNVTGGRITGQTPTLERDRLTAERERDAARLAFDKERTGNDTTLALLQMQANLRGPGDWAKYMQTAQAIPPEMRAMIGQTTGRFAMPTAPGGAASVAGMLGDINGPTQSTQPVGSMPMPGGGVSYTPPRFGEPGFNGPVSYAPGYGGPTQGIQPVMERPMGSATPMMAGPGGVATHQANPGMAVDPGRMENATMNAGIRAAAGLQTDRTPPSITRTAVPGPVTIPGGSIPRDLGGGVVEYRAPDGSTYRSATDQTTGRMTVTRTGGQGPGTVGPGGPTATGQPVATMPLGGPVQTNQPVRTMPMPAVPPARYLTGNQLPRSFLGAGGDAQDFVLGGAEAAGESRRQILHEFSQSLPNYQGSRGGRVRF